MMDHPWTNRIYVACVALIAGWLFASDPHSPWHAWRRQLSQQAAEFMSARELAASGQPFVVATQPEPSSTTDVTQQPARVSTLPNLNDLVHAQQFGSDDVTFRSIRAQNRRDDRESSPASNPEERATGHESIEGHVAGTAETPDVDPSGAFSTGLPPGISAARGGGGDTNEQRVLGQALATQSDEHNNAADQSNLDAWPEEKLGQVAGVNASQGEGTSNDDPAPELCPPLDTTTDPLEEQPLDADEFVLVAPVDGPIDTSRPSTASEVVPRGEADDWFLPLTDSDTVEEIVGGQGDTVSTDPVASVVETEHDRRVPTAVAERANAYADEGFDLAKRGAYYSARAQFLKTLRFIAQGLDAASSNSEHSEALVAGLRALDEAASFAPDENVETTLPLDHIIAAHRTPVLKSAPTDGLTVIAALQAYHAYAESQLAKAGGREPAAATALYGLARLQDSLTVGSNRPEAMRGPRAMSLYQAALLINPDHHLSANELGVLYARYGQLEDAREVLRHCVQIAPWQAQSWQNLAAVHERLGERIQAELAEHEAEVARTHQDARVARQPAVQWIDHQAFSTMSRRYASDPFAAPPKVAQERSESAHTVPGHSPTSPSLSRPARADDERAVGIRARMARWFHADWIKR